MKPKGKPRMTRRVRVLIDNEKAASYRAGFDAGEEHTTRRYDTHAEKLKRLHVAERILRNFSLQWEAVAHALRVTLDP